MSGSGCCQRAISSGRRHFMTSPVAGDRGFQVSFCFLSLPWPTLFLLLLHLFYSLPLRSGFTLRFSNASILIFFDSDMFFLCSATSFFFSSMLFFTLSFFSCLWAQCYMSKDTNIYIKETVICFILITFFLLLLC